MNVYINHICVLKVYYLYLNYSNSEKTSELGAPYIDKNILEFRSTLKPCVHTFCMANR